MTNRRTKLGDTRAMQAAEVEAAKRNTKSKERRKRKEREERDRKTIRADG